MVQDFTTSFHQFETFAVSEMAKQPQTNDPLKPFTPKFWSNRNSTNSMMAKYESFTSVFDTPLEGSLQDLFLTHRRSGRIANQTKINYNENMPKNVKHSQKVRRQKKSNACSKPSTSNTNRTKAIRTLFKKPNDGGDIAKAKLRSSSKKRVKVDKMAHNLRISIPLLSKSVTKASLKLFENNLTLKPRNSDFTMMEVLDGKCGTETILGSVKNCQIKNSVNIFDTSKKNMQTVQKHVIEVFKQRKQFSTLTRIESSNQNITPTENKFQNVFENSFSGSFTSYKNDNEDVLNKNENPNHNFNAKNVVESERPSIIETSDKKLHKCNGRSNNTPTKKKKVDQNIINEALEEREQSPEDFMEVSDETLRNEVSQDYQMMEISNKSPPYLEETLPKDSEHCSEDNRTLKKTLKPEQSIHKEAAEEKELPLDLTIMDVSDETSKVRNNQNIITEEDEDLSEEDLTIMEISKRISRSKKTSSNNAGNTGVSFFSALQKNGQPDKNIITEAAPCVEESHQMQTFSMSKIRNYEHSQAFEECTQLSDNLSIMKISEKIQKSKIMNNNDFEEKEQPCDLTIITEASVSEELQNTSRVNIINDATTVISQTFSDNSETSNDDDDGDDDVFTVENQHLGQNNLKLIFKKYQPQSPNQSTTEMEVLDDNENDHQAEEIARNEKKIIEELKSLIEESSLDADIVADGNEKPNEVNLTEISNDFKSTADTATNEAEFFDESNDSEIEVIEETFLDNSENLDQNNTKDDFTKSPDDVEFQFPHQGYNRVYQQDYIEVIHQYNYLPFQNYQYPRYVYPIEENKFDYRPTYNNLPFLSQRYGEFQVPQIHVDYNNYRMQVHPLISFEQENKLEITEYYDSEEEEKDTNKPQSDVVHPHDLQNKTLQVQPCNKSDQNQYLILSQPPPIQCSSEQQNPTWQNVNAPQWNPQLYLQPQSQIGQTSENSSPLQGYSQNNNLELINNNNQWQIVSTQNSDQTSSEQRDNRQLYENALCNIQVLPHNNDQNQSESQIVQRLYQVPTQNIVHQQLQTQNNFEYGPTQPLSQIAHFVKNNCHIHDVTFGKIKTLNGRLDDLGPMEFSAELPSTDLYLTLA